MENLDPQTVDSDNQILESRPFQEDGFEKFQANKEEGPHKHENSKYADPNDSMFVNGSGVNVQVDKESSILDVTHMSTAREGNMTHFNIQ